MTFGRLLAAAAASLGVLLWGCGQGQEGPTHLADLLTTRPGADVIVVSFDALRPDALGAYGYSRETSPHIDAFAREGLLFENAYSVAPKTPTSFAAAFTGRYSTSVFRDWRLTTDRTLAAAFATAGYRTAAFANNPQLSAQRGFDRGFETYRVHPASADARVVDDATAWLAARRGQKLFVWIHLLDPHAPWERHEGSSHLYQAGYRGRFEQRAARLLSLDDPAELARVRSLYDGEIYFADRLFGELLERLRALDLYEDSILVLTSDHGEEFMEHGHLQHGWLTQENLRIPLLIRHPGLRGGERHALRVSNLDLMPTLLALVGIDPPEGIDGRNLLEVEGGAGGGVESATLAAVANTERKRNSASILRGDTKLIVHCQGKRRRELYDLERDPGERDDLAAERRQQADALEAELWQLLGLRGCRDLPLSAARAAETEETGETRDLAPETIEALEDLGYLEQ